MKTIAVILSFFLLIVSSCSRDKAVNIVHNLGNDAIQVDTAYITGPDYRTCPCCGGYYITIKGKQYDIDTLPAGSNVVLPATSYPVKVRLAWTILPKCDSNYIAISSIYKL